MSKAEIVFLRDHKEKLISKLHEAGIMEINEVSEKIEYFSDYLNTAEIPRSEMDYREYHKKARDIVEILKKVEEEEKSLRDKIRDILSKSGHNLSKKEVNKEDFEFIKKIYQESKNLEKEFEEKNKEIERLNSRKEKLEPYSSLELPLRFIGKGKYIQILLGESSFEEAKKIKTELEEKDCSFWMDIKRKSEEKSIFAVAFLEEEVNKVLRRSKAELFENEIKITQPLKKELEEINNKIKSLNEKKSEIRSSLKDLENKNFEKIVRTKKALENEIERKEINNRFAESDTINLIEGWVPTEKVDELESIVKEVTDNNALLETREAKKEDNPPVELDNPSFLKGFESLVRTFGLPRYKEIDPTPILAFFLPLFFGIMFGDLGHGLIVLFVGLSLYWLSEGTINDFSKVIIPCGIFSMLFGFLYGEFMGLGLKEQQEMLGFSIPHHFSFSLHINPVEEAFNPKMFLLIAIGLGILHLVIGMSLDLVNKIKNNEYKS
ncbi:MAG: V-type ATP synthase subunit I, partial [Candidatus Nanohaloarchaea archaeon]